MKSIHYNTPTDKALLSEFDDKLLLVLEKLREKGTEEQKEAIGLYKVQADELKAAASDMLDMRDNSFKGKEMLARSIQTLDDLLADRNNEENNEQSLVLARDIGKSANGNAAAAASFGFLGVTFVVLAVVLAVTLTPVALLFLIELVPCGAGVVLGTDLSLSAAEGKEAFTSFTETGKGFFSDTEEGGTPEKEQDDKQKGSSWWPWGSDND